MGYKGYLAHSDITFDKIKSLFLPEKILGDIEFKSESYNNLSGVSKEYLFIHKKSLLFTVIINYNVYTLQVNKKIYKNEKNTNFYYSESKLINKISHLIYELRQAWKEWTFCKSIW